MPPNTAAGRASAIAPRPQAAKRVVPEPDPPAAPRSRRRSLIAAVLITLLTLAATGIGYKIVRNYFYVSAHEERVAIMRGVPGSILGVRLQQPFLLGCLNDRGELSEISYDQQTADLDCRLLRLQDLQPSGRAQVTAGLPAGGLDDAFGQLRDLARNSLLPPCAPPRAKGSPAKPPGQSGTARSVPPQTPGTDCRAAT